MVLKCRFEKSVGPNWPARQLAGSVDQGAGKENTRAATGMPESSGGGKYLVFTPVPDQIQL